MLKRTVLSVLVLASSAISFHTFAADGTVNFTGNITNAGCSVASDSLSKTVALGNVSSSALTTAGNTAGAHLFTINLTDCPEDPSAHVRFDGTTNASNSSILALTDAGQEGTATNVGVALYESDSTTPIIIGVPSSTINMTEGSNSLNFYAKYYATGAATAGTATSTATFTVVYQ